LVVSLASTESENKSGVNEYANTDNMSDVHGKLKCPGARLTYGVDTLWRQCGLRLSVGVWHFVPVSRYLVGC